MAVARGGHVLIALNEVVDGEQVFAAGTGWRLAVIERSNDQSSTRLSPVVHEVLGPW